MLRRFVAILAACSLLPLFTVYLYAQSGTFLSLENIMKGDEYIGPQPGNPWWSQDSRTIYFQWNPEGFPSDSLYSYDLKTGEVQKVSPRQRRELPPGQVVYDKKREKIIYIKNGDIFIRDLKRSETIQLTNTLQGASSPGFTKDEKGISYVSGNNLFVIDLVSGKTRQVTDFRKGSKPAEGSGSPQDQWLEEQQLDLFEVLRERKEMEEQREKQRENDKPERPLTIYTGNATAGNIQLNAGEKFVTYSLYSRQDAKQAIIPEFVTFSGYTEHSTTNAKVGMPGMSVSAGIYNIEKKTSYEIKTTDIPGIRDVPEYRIEYGFEGEELDEDREVLVTGIFWSEDGENAIVNIRAKDNKDRWIMLLDPENGELSLLDRQRDEAWIAGPGINIWGGGGMGWMPCNNKIWFQSEETGWSHLYTLDVNTGEKQALTSGNFEIYDPEISPDGKHWYFASNEVHPGERHFYRMPLEGGARTLITEKEGRNDAVISPDGKKLAVRYSYFNKPWELFIADNKPGAGYTRITNSLTAEFKEYEWREPELLTFTAGDGEEVWARLYRPEDPDPDGPAVIFVHGAGYLQNAHKWWSSYLREYMFHNLLADKGYTVLDIDYRGSAGYGRDWRTGIYRHMGGKDLSDNVDGARFLVEEYDIDPSRIGIYGGSYGGFITLMGMFNHPDIFSAGAALRSVTDWAHYNHGYTSNILNTPVSDSLAFVRSSPIYFAEGLEGDLLMCHGMVDDNVHFQDIVRLTQRLIELGKEDWELAVYPVERHSFTETSSWVDEYRRILKLFEVNLK
ncbi:MAG: prolyl oligopeptidase family serine peptidase [Bacteroidales bacterium]